MQCGTEVQGFVGADERTLPRGVLWTKLCPPLNSYVEALTLNMAIWRQSLKKVRLNEVSSLGL